MWIIAVAQVEIVEAGLLNPEKEWTNVLGRGGYGRVVRQAVAFDGSEVAIKIVQIVERKKVQINDLLTAFIH